MSKEIPQKGWYILKEGIEPNVAGTKVYLDGKVITGIQKLSVELDAERNLPVLKLEILPVEGVVVDTTFGSLNYCSRPVEESAVINFRSSQTPEEILKVFQEKEAPPETEVL
jgi:hypothetical protein